MSEHPDDEFQDTNPGTPPPQDARSLRRRLLKAGVMAVPVVLTLRGRPAQADVQYASPGNDQFFVTGHSTENHAMPGEPSSFLDAGSPSSDATWSSSSWSSDDSSGEATETGSN